MWTRHLAPAAPASRRSLPTQFHDCSCHADSALQFFPSLLLGWGKSRAASNGFRALSPLDRVRGVACNVSHFGARFSTGMLVCAGPSRPHRDGGGGGRTRVTSSLCSLGQTFLSQILCFRLLRFGALLVFGVSHKNGRPGQPSVGAQTAFKWRQVLG